MSSMASFGQHYPDQNEGALDCMSYAITCSFNLLGSMLAVGCNDGRVVIWDFVTMKIAKILNAHVHPVTTVQWIQKGRNMITASTDNCLYRWNLITDTWAEKYTFPSHVMKVQVNPGNENQILINILNHLPVVLTGCGKHECLPMNTEGDLNVVLAFDRDGKHIYTGNYHGRVAVFNAQTLQVVASFRILTGNGAATAIRVIAAAPKSDEVVIATADRCLRLYDSNVITKSGQCRSLDPKRKYHDIFNNAPWKRVCFSSDGEYFCSANTKHVLFIWERSTEILLKKLNMTKDDMLLDMSWHPQKATIVTLSSGLISLWGQNQQEHWHAYQKDFREIDENVCYEEGESEFDLEDEDESPAPSEYAESVSSEELEIDDDNDYFLHFGLTPELVDVAAAGTSSSYNRRRCSLGKRKHE